MSDPIQTPKTKTGMRPWLKAVLFASLALNLAVAGLVIGAVLRFGPFDGPRPPRLDMVVGPYTHALSMRDKRAIGMALREEYRAARPSRAQMRAEFSRMLEALRSSPYDGARVAAILERQVQAGMERQALGQRLLLERLETMTLQDRAAFADRLEEGLKRRDHDGKRSGYSHPHRDHD